MNLDQATLRKLQLTQLEIAKEVKRICINNKINYFLDFGSLLGAVRHRGFIPWDDDLDMGMMREEYNKFISCAKKELGSEYYLQYWLDEENYGLPFIKIRKKGTICLQNTARKVEANNGIYIDIYPYDQYVDKPLTQGFPLMLLRRMILAKCGYYRWEDENNRTKRMIHIPFHLLSWPFDTDKLKYAYEKKAQLYNFSDLEFLFANSASNYGKWVIDKHCFDEFIELPFEDDLFMCPIGYEKRLKSSYGDYMQLPPEDKRISKHDIVEVKFL